MRGALRFLYSRTYSTTRAVHYRVQWLRGGCGYTFLMETRIATPDDMAAVYDLRWRVFVLEQDVPFLLEMDTRDTDADTIHVVGVEDGQVVATARILDADSPVVHVGRVAVDDGGRGRGWGRSLMQGVHRVVCEQARRRGASEVTVSLAAQSRVRDFYAALGYEAVDGREFEDAGIMHVEMVTSLQVS